jgi:hypothetical protein
VCVSQVAGYVQKYQGNFTFATVHGAGHEVSRMDHFVSRARDGSCMYLGRYAAGAWPLVSTKGGDVCLHVCVPPQVPAYKPEAALALFNAFLMDQL